MWKPGIKTKDIKGAWSWRILNNLRPSFAITLVFFSTVVTYLLLKFPPVQDYFLSQQSSYSEVLFIMLYKVVLTFKSVG